MLDKYKDYKNVKMPEDMKNNILNNVREGIEMRSSKPKLAVKRRVLIYAAALACLVMVVSAAVIYNNRVQYVPGFGFTDRDLEIYAIPEIIEFGSDEVVIETIARIKDPETGQSNLTVIMTIITSDRNLVNNEFTRLTVTTPYGQEHILETEEVGGSSTTGRDGVTRVYHRTSRFLYEDFPEINEFTITGEDISAEVMLTDSVFTELYGYIEKDGVYIIMRHLTKGSRAMAYTIHDNNINLDELFGEGHQMLKMIWAGGISIYDEAGNNLTERGFSRTAISDRDGRLDVLMVFEERPEGRIKKAVIEHLKYEIRWFPNFTFDGEAYVRDEVQRRVYADIDIPVPANGARIEFEEPLVIFDKNGFTTSVVYAVERNGNELTVTMPTHVVDGLIGGVPVSNLNMTWTSGWGWRGVGQVSFNITDEHIENQSLRLSLMSMFFAVFANWEINFGE